MSSTRQEAEPEVVKLRKSDRKVKGSFLRAKEAAEEEGDFCACCAH